MELRTHPMKIQKFVEMLGFDGFVFSENRGYSGGIVFAWKKDVVEVECNQVESQFIHTKVMLQNGNFFFFTTVYASPNEDTRHGMWNNLKGIADNMVQQWLLVGDFNDIMYPEEKKGGAPPNERRCRVFRDRADSCKLFDLGVVGSKFTWRGPIYNHGARILERLDRAFSNDIWRLTYPNAVVKTLPRVMFSDHHPLLISLDNTYNDVMERPFRFESAWQIHDSFQTDLQSWWHNRTSLLENLNMVETKLRTWKNETFGNVKKKKKDLLARLGGIQKKRDTNDMNRYLASLEHMLQTDLAEILQYEELMWHQRSRAKWLYDGDRNTKYYHIKAVNRKRRNKIVMLRNCEGD
ncbi:hypothetical protein P8452_03545 [Trifolium repens]|nr:hypothetical protein P8452_03545 [Trifolium repens]